ncbi:hypothetical protein ACWC98_32800 [Streptomyces goshikiensis]|uniref:hypothetical protein n=1 Tax=Streptomyces goshikiensis TaxID=1942 RepID=UPI0036676C3B
MLLVHGEEAEAREGIPVDAPEGPDVDDAHKVRKGALEGGELPYRDRRFVLVLTTGDVREGEDHASPEPVVTA